jgi:hypothetical protein
MPLSLPTELATTFQFVLLQFFAFSPSHERGDDAEEAGKQSASLAIPRICFDEIIAIRFYPKIFNFPSSKSASASDYIFLHHHHRHRRRRARRVMNDFMIL